MFVRLDWRFCEMCGWLKINIEVWMKSWCFFYELDLRMLMNLGFDKYDKYLYGIIFDLDSCKLITDWIFALLIIKCRIIYDDWC